VSGTGQTWILNVQKRAFDRIRLYWLPRLYQQLPLDHSQQRWNNCHTYPLTEGELVILNSLACNIVAGDAFQHYLMELYDGFFSNEACVKIVIFVDLQKRLRQQLL